MVTGRKSKINSWTIYYPTGWLQGPFQKFDATPLTRVSRGCLSCRMGKVGSRTTSVLIRLHRKFCRGSYIVIKSSTWFLTTNQGCSFVNFYLDYTRRWSKMVGIKGEGNWGAIFPTFVIDRNAAMAERVTKHLIYHREISVLRLGVWAERQAKPRTRLITEPRLTVPWLT